VALVAQAAAPVYPRVYRRPIISDSRNDHSASTQHMSAYKMHAREVYAHEIHARQIYAHEVMPMECIGPNALINEVGGLSLGPSAPLS
jgi:hypothetical protein